MSPFARLSTCTCYLNSQRSPAWLLAAGIVFFALATSPIGCGDDDGGPAPIIRHPQDFLPPGTEAMPKDGNLRTATDTAGLQDIVTGGFENYTSNGFLEMVEQVYSGTVGGASATVRVWIFDMGADENAASLHDLILQEGSWEDWGVLGDEDHRKSGLLGFVTLFRRDNYSVQLDISSNSQDARDLLVLFASHIDQEIQG